MANKKVQNQIQYHKEREEYIPNDINQPDPVFKKLNQARMMLFVSSLIHIGACVIFIILLIIGIIIGPKIGFNLENNTDKALAFSYVICCVLVDSLVFLIPSKKAKKKNQFRALAIATLIFSTLILSGSLIFWSVPILLFYSLITLIFWVVEIIAAIFFLLVVEALPN